ncbi:MAG: filamentous hemagglutinin N-terminal domain-containing protein, partial [Gammaproteobacteria bacterium]|nr:filamentous hemagglutinin N-terminal domain-containing protein [Gammaproteobacteria bacterium]
MKRIFLNESSNNEAIDTTIKHQRRRSASLLSGFALALVTAGPALAGPTGGNVVGGEATITGGVNLTEINQATNRVSINWDTFNVAANETVRFIQPSSTSVALNTIFDQNPSQIFGVIDANGRVLLINPNGMIFGPTSQVNVAGLVASSLNISTADFMAGNHSFESAAGAGGLVLNQGALQAAPGGFIALLGEAVANEGLIVADAGTIAMAAGSKVALDFDGSGLLYFAVESDVLNSALGVDAAVNNTGSLFADGGQVLLTASAAQDVYTNAINNEGLIRARRIDDAGGVVRLVGTGAPVIHSGSIDVSGGDQDSTGGTAELLGEKVGIAAGASINADGVAGGGTILVGGDVQGGGDAQTADFTYVGDGAVLSADALGQGDGGTVVVWAEEVARVYGDISARGGAAGGDGGFVETSGKSYLDFNGNVDASAASGSAGTWLLDPRDILITNLQANITENDPGGDPGPVSFTPIDPALATTIDVANINAALDLGSSVTINTTSAPGPTPGNITVDAAIAKVADGGNVDGSTLTLIADNNIDVNQSITSTTGLLNVDLQANGIIDIDANVTTNGGNFTANTPGITAFDSSGFLINTTGAEDAAGGNVSVVVSGQITTGGITTSGGNATAAGQDAGFVALVGDVLDIGAITATGSASVGATPGGAGGAVTLGDVDTPPTSITLNGDIDSSGGAGTPQGAGGEVQINGPSILAANRVINTGATAGNVIFEDAVVSLDGGQSLTVTAGTGAVTLAAAGQGVATNQLTELNVTGAGINLGGNITTNTATGIVLNGATTLTADVTLDSSTNDGVVNLSNAAVTDDATPRTLNIVAGAGQIDLDAVTVGSIDATTSGTVNVGGNVTTDGAGGIALQGATIDLADTFGLVSNGQDISLTADTMTDGATSTIDAGSGTVTLTPLNPANDVLVCDEDGNNGCGGAPVATEYDLESYVITAGTLQIGATGQTGGIELDAATLGGGQAYNLALLNAAAGNIIVSGIFNGQGLSIDSTTGAINLDADVSTNGGDAVFADTVTLGANLTVDTNGTTDGNANFRGAIESDNGNQLLVVDAGTGTVTLGNVGVGPTNSLTSLNVTGGTINLGGDINTTNDAGIVLTGTKNLTADVSMTTSGDTVNLASGEIVSEDGTQGLTIAAGVGTVSLGDVGQGVGKALTSLDVTGGTINLGGNITTNTATGIVLNGATTLTANVTLDSSTNDGVVNLSNAAVTDDATPRTLNIVAGAGQIDLD